MNAKRSVLRLVRATDSSPPSPVDTYLCRLSQGSSRETVDDTLRLLAQLLSHGALSDSRAYPWHQLTYPDVLRLRTDLLQRYSTGTARCYLGRLRQVLRECWRLALMSRDAMERALDVPTISAHHMPQRILSEIEMAALWAACRDDPTPQGIRDTALLAVLIGAGLRRAELAALNLADVDLETGRMVIRRGKGNKPREAWLSAELLTFVQVWVDLRGGHDGPLWHPISQRHILRYRALSAVRIAEVLGTERAKEAGLKPFFPHALRRHFANQMDKSGVRLKTISTLLGHARPETTLRHYINSDVKEAEAVARAISAPK
jgi:integrase/recombinase XerD